MTVTVEPRGLNWINNVNMSSFGSLVTNLCWFIGSAALTTVACALLLRKDYHLANGTLVIVEMQRQLGLTLAGFLLAAWTGKTTAGVFDAHNKRTASPAYAAVVEAKERGRVAGALEARQTQEHGALPAVTVTAKDQSTIQVDASPEPPRRRNGDLATPERPSGEVNTVDHEWERGDPREGVL